MDDYWTQIETQEAMLRLDSPKTAAEVIRILGAMDPQTTGVAGQAFYSGANAGYSLAAALQDAGWEMLDYQAEYHFTLINSANEVLEYVEGDVYAR